MKNILIVLALALITNTIIAQSSLFTLGPKIGYNSSSIKSELSQNYVDFKAAAKGGLMGGIFLRFNASNIYFQPEAYLSTRNSKLNYNFNNQQISNSIYLTSIEIPILLGVKLVNLKKFNLRLDAGPVATFIINKKIEQNETSQPGSALTKDDFKDKTWSAQIGTGIDVFAFTLDVRYELGISNISKSSILIDAKQNMFFICLGLKLL